MEEWVRFNLPASQKGHAWTPSDIERAKDWFSQHCLESAVSLAFVQLSNAEYRRNLMASYDKLGNVKLKLGQTESALTHYETSFKAAEELVALDPDTRREASHEKGS